MQKFCCFSFVLLLSCTLAAQNTDGFEAWEFIGEWEVPVGWEVNNTFEVYPCSVKEDEAFSGEYALRLRSYGPSFEGFASGLAMRKFYIAPNEGLLAVAVKVDSMLSGGFAAIRVTSKASNYNSPIGEWLKTELTDGFEYIEVLLDEASLPDSVMVIFESGTTPGPLGYDGYTEMVVDQLEFVLNVSAQEEANPSKGVRIFPMPVREQAAIELTGWDGAQEIQFELLDVNGRLALLARGAAPKLTIERNGLPAGLYAYRIRVAGSVVQTGSICLVHTFRKRGKQYCPGPPTVAPGRR